MRAKTPVRFRRLAAAMTWAVCLLFAACSGGAAQPAEQPDAPPAPFERDNLPRWQAGVRGGIPDVPNQANAKDAGAIADGKTDDTGAIQQAINGVKPPGAVYLPEGTYLLKGQLNLRSGVVLRGAGMDKTHLRCENPQGWSAVVRIVGGAAGPEVPLAAGYEAASARLTTAGAPGLEPGQYFVILSDNDPKLHWTHAKWERPYAKNLKAQVLRAAAVDGTTIEIDRPLYLTQQKRFNPRIKPLKAIERAGIEDLHISRANDYNTFIFVFDYAADCWVRRCHTEYGYRGHVWIQYSRGITVRDCVMHHAHDYGGGGHGYGIVAGHWATDCLFENNLLFSLRHAMMTKEGACGNVFAYNASYDCKWVSDISQHGHYPYMNLFEGNVVTAAVFSDWWGPVGPGNTCFRNRVRAGIRVEDHSHDQNVIGNTIRKGGVKVSKDSMRARVEKNLFLKSSPSGRDAVTLKSPAPAWQMPASLYLKEKPAFWGTRPWPAIGADVDRRSGKAGRGLVNIPAEDLYEKFKKAD